MSTQPQSSRFVIVLTFDVPMGLAALHDVVKTIQEAKLPHLVSPIHLAKDDVADRVLAEFDKDGT